VSILDDHDHVSGAKVRFLADASPADHQVVAGVALQLFGLGIPCIYYGTEQAFAGPEAAVRRFVPEYGSTDRYLREAMFGPEHPRNPGRAGIGPAPASIDATLPGFGPFGTAGAHAFDPRSPAYVRIAALARARRRFPVLRYGRQYPRAISNFGAPFAAPGPGELIAWSRVLDDEEALVVVNGNGGAARGGDIVVDAALNDANAPGAPFGAGGAPAFEVVANSAQAAAGASYAGPHRVGERVPVQVRGATAFVAIRDVPPAEVVVLVNRG
jgi:hypothetical protein